MKFNVCDEEVIIDKILEIFPFAPKTIKQYEDEQRIRFEMGGIFNDFKYDAHIQIQGIEIAVLGEDINYNSFQFLQGSIIEFDEYAKIRSGFINKTKYMNRSIPRNAQVFFNRFYDVADIIFSGHSILYDHIPAGKDEQDILRKIFKNKDAPIFTNENYDLLNSTHDDGSKYLGYYRREGRKFGSNCIYDNHNDEIPDFPFENTEL